MRPGRIDAWFKAFAFLATLSLIPAFALADATWNTSVSNGSWNTPGNWVGGNLPVSADNVYVDFNDASGHTITYDGTFSSTLGLRVRNSGNGSATLGLFTGSYSLQVGSLNVGETGRGIVDQDTGGLTAASDLYLGYSGTGAGSYLLSGGGLNVGSYAYVGYGGTGVFDQSGGTLNVGTLSATSILYVGYTGGSVGTYLLNGSGVLKVMGDEYVGFNGTGFFNQSGGTHDIGWIFGQRNLSVGTNTGSTGTYLLSAGTLNVWRNEYVGWTGTGVFTQSGGIHTIGPSGGSHELIIGGMSGGSGTYALNGSAAQLTVNGPVYVGGNGTATGGAGVLNLSAGSMTVLDVLKIWNTTGTAVNFSGGELSVLRLDTNGNLARFNWSGGTLTLRSPFYVQGGGQLGSAVSLGAGKALRVTAEEYVGYVGGAGTVDQSGGFHDVGTASAIRNLYIGNSQAGTYLLSGGGMLNVTGNEYIGKASGTFKQSGGTHNIGIESGTSTLTVGDSASGTYLFSSGVLNVNANEYVGLLGNGLFDQSGGSHNLGTAGAPRELHLGYNASRTGTYLLSGSGAINAIAHEYIGSSGTGLFDQSGGTHSIGTAAVPRDLNVGSGSTGRGTYTLSGGELNVSGYEYVGNSGTGLFDQSGGVHTIGPGPGGDLFFIGRNSGAAGTYLLGGSGALTVYGSEFIGRDGTGVFDQSAGTHTIGTAAVPTSLIIGYNSTGPGTYTLSGGVLTTIGGVNVGQGGAGVFDQSGGVQNIGTTSTPRDLTLGFDPGSTGTYLLSGGTLNVGRSLVLGRIGTALFNQSGGTHSIGVYAAGDFLIGENASSTYLLCDGMLNVNGTVTLGMNGPGRFEQSGGTNSVGTTGVTRDLYIGRNSAGQGSYVLSSGVLNVSGITNVGYSGTGIFNQAGGIHNVGTFLQLGVKSTGVGTYLLSGTGSLNISASEYIGYSGAGAVSQSGGTHSMGMVGEGHYLLVGVDSSGHGTYTLSGGALNAHAHVEIGYNGIGSFIQSGGTLSVGTSAATKDLYLGNGGTSRGTYALSNGELNVSGHEYLGNDGTGDFGQSGGTHRVGTSTSTRNLYLGNNSGGRGTYTLSGGELKASGYEFIGYYGTGFLEQSAGTNTIGDTTAQRNLYVGYLGTSHGTYALSGGELNVIGNERIGESGIGVFDQSGGTHTVGKSVTGMLYLGVNSGAVGTYLLSGAGVLDVRGDEIISYNGAGLFDQSGGTHTVGTSATPRMLTIAPFSAHAGTYLLSGGVLNVTAYENLGNSGPGLFNQSGGAHNIGTTSAPQDLYMGANASGAGTYSLGGDGVLNVSGDEYVGSMAQGTFVQSGGTNNVGTTSAARNLILSNNNAASGTYLLSGSGVLNVSGGMGIGGDLGIARGMGVFDVSGGTASIAGALKVWTTGSSAFNLSGGEVTVGTLNLSGDASRMNWTGGTLRINVSAPAGDGTLTVPGAGTLGGVGTIARATDVSPGGVVGPGGSVGKMTFTNDLTLQSSGPAHAVLEVEVGGTADAGNAGATYDQLVISGAGNVVTVGGAILRLITLPGIELNQPYQIVRATSGGSVDFTSMFSNLSSGTSYSDANVSYAVSYNTNTGVFVTFSMVPEPTFPMGIAILLLSMRRRVHRRQGLSNRSIKTTSVAPPSRGNADLSTGELKTPG